MQSCSSHIRRNVRWVEATPVAGVRASTAGIAMELSYSLASVLGWYGGHRQLLHHERLRLRLLYAVPHVLDGFATLTPQLSMGLPVVGLLLGNGLSMLVKLLDNLRHDRA